VTLRFAYSSELYGDARRAQLALHEQVRVPPSAKLRSVRVSGKAIAMKGLVVLERDIAVTAGMLSMATYRILNLARRVAAGQSGGTK
jgi:Tfp pilus assembly protein PilN